MKSENVDFLVDAARTTAGLALRGERAYHAMTRLEPIARREGCASVEVLIERLRTEPEPALTATLVAALAPADTSFFRDREVFDRLRDEILPDLASRRAGGVVRLWCAGVATGQEVYSVAMMAAEASAVLAGAQVQLFASDLCARSLQKARVGVYSHFEVQRGLPIRMLLEHFTRADDMWRVVPELRQRVRWAQINLIDDFTAMGPFDAILCRNVLSDLEPAVAEEALARFDRVIARDGWLVLGPAETALHPPAAFEGAGGVYRRNPAFARATA